MGTKNVYENGPNPFFLFGTKNVVRPTLRAVLMGTKSCTKILNFSTRFSCENLAVEDFVTLLMGKKSC